jgi:LPS sulfotransferase NodH
MANDTIILVSGLPRSGTSLMMKMLEAGGLTLLVDHVRQADEDNPKGYYEFEPVKAMKAGDSDWLPDARGKVVKVVAPLLKYLPEGGQYRIVFMRRAMPEILASQKKMLERRGQDPDAIPDDVIAAAFEKQLDEVLRWMAVAPNVDFIEVDYAALVANAPPIISELVPFLGGEIDSAAMAAVVDPTLYRQRAGGG